MDTVLDILGNLAGTISDGLLRFGVGLLILVLAWFVARFVRGIIRRLMSRTDLDNRFAETMGGDAGWPIESMVAQAGYILVMLFGVMAFLNHVQLEAVGGPIGNLVDELLNGIPRLLSAAGLLVLAYVIASVVRMLITKGGDAAGLDKRIATMDSETAPTTSVTASLGTAGFWLTMLLFLPSVLNQLGMASLVGPLNDMLQDLLGALPNLLKAGLVLVIGMFVARLVRQIVTSLMSAANVDRFAAGLDISITNLVGTLVYTVILLLTIVQALETLAIESISGPATEMIGLIFSSIPNVIGAGLLLGISFLIARLVADLVKNLLQSAGFDNVPTRMGLNLDTERSLSDWAGWVIIVGTMLLAAVPAAEMLGFGALTEIVSNFITFGSQILTGIILMGIGVFVANFARDFMLDTGQSNFSASIVRAAVLVLVGAMALQAIGIGEDIVQLAFGIGIGAIGIAAALAFGLGSRDIAGREVERFVTTMRTEDEG
ncbi:MAG: mechanosensitive ion channel [Candidatus Promineifilaceae bacterium]